MSFWVLALSYWVHLLATVRRPRPSAGGGREPGGPRLRVASATRRAGVTERPAVRYGSDLMQEMTTSAR